MEQTIDKFRQLARDAVSLPSDADFRQRWKEIAGTGLLGLADIDSSTAVSTAVAAVEGVGLAGVAPGLVYAAASQLFGIQIPLRRLLSESQRERLAGVPSGSVLLCHASTEEGGGSDPLATGTGAVRRDDNSFVLNGTKSYVTAAPVADLALVFARTEPGRSPFALSAFLVDLRSPGVTVHPPVAKTALTDVPMGVLSFSDVVVPSDALVAGEGAGLSVIGVTTAWERALLLSYALGPMRLLLDRTVQWCQERQHFGRTMGASHQVAGRIADMALRVHRSRALLYSIATRLDAGIPIRRLAAEAAMTKISVTEDYVALTQDAAMLAGVRAYLGDSPLHTDPHSALAGLTYAGPNDLLRVAVARELGLPVEN
jgi:alkylation response protein AidB-like acyl-CoA dehydrogenase